MASLASGPLSASETYAVCEIDFENDPLQPDWQNLEKEGTLPALREAKSRIYAEGSQGEIRASLRRWMHFTATKARVCFIRPRVGDDPEAFMTESLLRQAFVADCVSGGCDIETAERYASLFSSWHIGTMGCGLISSRSFEDEQFRRTNQGLRRMFPSKRIDRAAHSVELNASVFRGSLSEVLAIYDEPSATMIDKCQRMELVLARGAGGGFDRGLVEDLVCSTLTEPMTGDLPRPGEGVHKKGFHLPIGYLFQEKREREVGVSDGDDYADQEVGETCWRQVEESDRDRRSSRRRIANGRASWHPQHGGSVRARLRGNGTGHSFPCVADRGFES